MNVGVQLAAEAVQEIEIPGLLASDTPAASQSSEVAEPVALATEKPQSEPALIPQDKPKPSKPSEDEIQRLIEQLGDSDNLKREDAFKRLTDIGEPAKALLEAASRHPNRGIRTRSELILDDIATRIRQGKEQANRLLIEEGKLPPFAMPAWELFAESAGDDLRIRPSELIVGSFVGPHILFPA